MTLRKIDRPEAGEFAPYTTMYFELVPDDNRVLDHLSNNVDRTAELARSFSEEQLVTPCGPDEWTIKEILVHIIDDERIYAYRALRFARGDQTALPGFEQDDYVPYSRANDRDLEEILRELKAVRESTVALFNSFSDEDLRRQGVGSGNPLSVRAAAYHIAGHELHHLESIRQNYG